MTWRERYRAFLMASDREHEQQVGYLAESISFEESLAQPLKAPGVDATVRGIPTEIKAKIVRPARKLTGSYIDLSEHNLRQSKCYLIFVFEPHRPLISMYEIGGVSMHQRQRADHSVGLGFLRHLAPY